MPVDVFQTERLARVHQRVLPPRSFIRDTFFTESDTFNEPQVRVDVVNASRRILPFSSAKGQGTQMNKRGYASRTYTPPYLKPFVSYTAQDLQRRAPGVQLQNSGTDRLQRLVVQDLRDLNDGYTRTEELMCIQALVDHQIPIVGDGVQDTVDFGSQPWQDVTPAVLWSDLANSDPLRDIENARLPLSEHSGLSGNVVVLGRTARNHFLDNAKIMAKLDLMRYQTGNVNVTELPNGLEFIGTFNGAFEVWSYIEYYRDEATQNNVHMFPENKVLIGSRAARCVRNYGAIEDLDASGMGQLLAARSWPKSWVEPNPSARYLMVQGAPLPTPVENLGFVTLTVSV